MFLAVPNGPANFRRVGFRPPAIQLGKIQAAVDEDLHSARPACFPRPPGRVDPKIDALDQFLSQQHVVIVEKNNAALDLWTFDEVLPLFDQHLPRHVLRMSFAGEDQLNRALGIGEKANQSLRIMQEKIGTLVRGKAPRESHREHILVKNAARIRRSSTFRGELRRVAFAHTADQRSSSSCAQLPQLARW